MKIIIQFMTRNAAFEDDPDLPYQILEAIIGRIKDGDKDGIIRDTNGNDVGDWLLTNWGDK
jgi:hypothetical protein